MSQSAKGNIIPGMRYRDAPAAIEWLCEAFGFSPHLVVLDDRGGIAHAQLTLGNGMIMLGSVRESEGYDGLVKTPEEAGTNTQAPYIVIEEIDGHYRQAKQAGAEIVYEIADQDYGGRLYTARDPEGYLWNFGSYDPYNPRKQPANGSLSGATGQTEGEAPAPDDAPTGDAIREAPNNATEEAKQC